MRNIHFPYKEKQKKFCCLNIYRYLYRKILDILYQNFRIAEKIGLFHWEIYLVVKIVRLSCRSYRQWNNELLKFLERPEYGIRFWGSKNLHYYVNNIMIYEKTLQEMRIVLNYRSMQLSHCLQDEILIMT